MGLYEKLVRPMLFRAEPEWIHDRSIRLAELLPPLPRPRTDQRLVVDVAGLRFASPLGLAAGFDKNARAVPLLSSLGFGHVEVGSISAHPSAGNPRPRLYRLPAEQAIVVHYGVPNEGAQRVAERLTGQRRRAPLGINVVNTNRGPDAPQESEESVIADYVESVRRLRVHADYLCLNLSCPNTREGLFRDPSRLLAALGTPGVPLFLKVAPFPDAGAVDAFLEAVDPFGFVSGFSVNLPPGDRPGMPGAVSGRPAAPAADETIRELYRRMDTGRYAIIGSGGVFSAEDAYRKIRLGASLVQLLTALIYRGPGIARQINRDLPRLLARDGFSRVSDAVGADT